MLKYHGKDVLITHESSRIVTLLCDCDLFIYPFDVQVSHCQYRICQMCMSVQDLLNLWVSSGSVRCACQFRTCQTCRSLSGAHVRSGPVRRAGQLVRTCQTCRSVGQDLSDVHVSAGPVRYACHFMKCVGLNLVFQMMRHESLTLAQ